MKDEELNYKKVTPYADIRIQVEFDSSVSVAYWHEEYLAAVDMMRQALDRYSVTQQGELGVIKDA